MVSRGQIEECAEFTAKRYGLNIHNFVETIRIESQFYANPCGIVGHCDNGKAIGVGQFHQDTWDLFVELFKEYLPDTFTGDIYNPRDQITLMAVSWSVSDQLAARHWSAWRYLTGNL